jgi:nucleoid-associated protein YgaU
LALLIIVLGICTALPFQRAPRRNAEEHSPQRDADPVATDSQDLTLQVASSVEEAEAHEQSVADAELPATEARSESPPALRRHPTLDGTPPPRIPAEYAPLSSESSPNDEATTYGSGKSHGVPEDAKDTVENIAASVASDEWEDGAADAGHQPSAPTASRPTGSVASAPAPQVVIGRVAARAPYPSTQHPRPVAARKTLRHRVLDGDSLEALAEQYLGSRELAHEIFEANRNLLASPDLLPIGIELIIPPNRSGSGNGYSPTNVEHAVDGSD